jgi:VWFA-related protein
MKLFLLLAALGTVLASPQDDVVFRSGVSLVRVDAEAIDAGGRVVAGLTKDDFRVLDEGVSQSLVNFSFEEDPLDLILLFDTAGSMRGKLLSVVRATELGFHELRRSDRISVRAFSSDSTEILPFTDNLQAVNEAILIQVLKLKFGGTSRLEPAVHDAALRFRSEPTTHRKRAVLVITDKPGSRGSNESAVVRDLWNVDAVVSELILNGAPQTRLMETGTNVIVDKTGGAAIVAGNPGEAFRDSVHYVRSGYTMYYALPDAIPGAERRLQVELTPEAAKRLPNTRIRARSGYLVAK